MALADRQPARSGFPGASSSNWGLGCDGLWDVTTPDDAYSLAKRKAKSRMGVWDLEKAAKALVEDALERKTGDNVSVVVIGLKRPRKGSTATPSRGSPSTSQRSSSISSTSGETSPAAGGTVASTASSSDSVNFGRGMSDRVNSAVKYAKSLKRRIN